jgi:tetratricopeptide (TPR) repeat protein
MCGLLSNLGDISIEQEQFIQAETYFKEGIVLARQLKQQEWISVLLINLGSTTLRLKNYQRAKDYLQESLAVAREVGIPQIIANSLYEYGNLYLELQQFDSAKRCFEDMLTIIPEGSQDLLALAQYGLAQVMAAQGKQVEARKLGEESIALLTAIGHRNINEVRNWLLSLSQ